MEQVPHEGAAPEREEEWAGEVAQVPGEEAEEQAGRERAQAREGIVSVRNAGRPSLISPACPVLR